MRSGATGQAEGFGDPVEQLALGRGFSLPPLQRFAGVADRVGHHVPLGAALGAAEPDLALSLVAQGLGEQAGFIGVVADEDLSRHRLVGVELADEAAHHVGDGLLAVVAGEIGAVAVVPPGTIEEHLHADLAAAVEGGDDVGVVDFALHVDVLMRLHRAQRPQSVAELGRALELQVFCRVLHAGGQFLLHRTALPEQEGLGLAHQFVVAGLVDLAHAGRRAALDLVEKTGAVAVLEHAVRAGAEQERLFQRGDGAVDRLGAGKRGEVVALPLVRPAVFGDPGEVMLAGEHDVGEGFVVAQQHVVARLEPLDQVGLQQQGFDLAIGDHDLQRLGLRHHPAQPIGQSLELGVVGDPSPKVAGLADVDRVAPAVEHAVDPGGGAQGADAVTEHAQTVVEVAAVEVGAGRLGAGQGGGLSLVVGFIFAQRHRCGFVRGHGGALAACAAVGFLMGFAASHKACGIVFRSGLPGRTKRPA